MRLAHIRLAGFKSFVDPTTIPVSHDLVGIVGPNGCGKSNIIDAVRWVLGESKASALRGDSMHDVIFAGSGNRKAVGRASVEIVFDNHLGKASGQWSSYAEIAIKRVLQRDGASNYYINNLPVRRRDIADLFLGTGAGSRGYAIIEQGMISQIIEAKPQELRNFLEEAAGISQYRERRQETASRLAETRKNLIRLQDIQQELGVQLRHLQAQAAVALQYQALQEKLRQSQALLWFQRKTEIALHYEQIKHEIAGLETELQAAIATQRNAEKAFEELRADEYLSNERLLQVQGQLYGADAEIGRLEQQIAHIQAAKGRLLQQAQSLGDQLQKNAQTEADSVEQLAQWQRNKNTAEQDRELLFRQQEIQNQQLPALEADHRQQQEALHACRHQLLAAEQNNRLENNHIAHADKNIQQLETRRARLLKEQAGLIPADPGELLRLQQEIDQTDAALEQAYQKQQTLERQLSEAMQAKQQLAQEVQESRHNLAETTARQTALHNLQQKLDNNQQLSAWLNARNWQILPRLWQSIQIASHWETALEAVLRERLNSIRFAQLDQLMDSLTEIPTGKWSIFDEASPVALSDEREPVADPVRKKTLLNLLTFHQLASQQVLEDWLRYVYVAENIQEALAQRSDLQTGEMLVTPEGHIVTRHSCTFYAPDSDLHGVLSRQQELAVLRTEIDRIENRIAGQKNHLAQADAHHHRLNADMQQVREQTKQFQSQLHQLQLEAVKRTQANERISARNQQVTAELSEIDQTLNGELASRQAATKNLAVNQRQIEALKQTEEQAKHSWHTADTVLAEHRRAIQQTTRQIHEITFQLTTAENKIAEIQLTLHRLDEDKLQLTANRGALQKEIDQCDDTSIRALLHDTQRQRKTTEAAVQQARQETMTIAQQLRDIEITRLQSEQKSQTAREAIAQARLKEQAALLNIGQLDDMLTQANTDMSELIPLVGKKSITALQNEIQKLTKETAALGPVNLAAIGEVESMQARESNLLIQLKDLNEAIEILENAIRQIDRETQMRLQETFVQVNTYLEAMFSSVFAGGQAKLVLLDDTVIDAGFVLTAQPPGKKNTSIHLLSGGEKALTALALVFSLFKLNPAPFCLLDEVDAPLDDTNAERFCELVKKMAAQTQFLFISHNKITMEMADRLIGVTMQEQGVSKIVAVDLADAVKLRQHEMRPIIE